MGGCEADWTCVPLPPHVLLCTIDTMVHLPLFRGEGGGRREGGGEEGGRSCAGLCHSPSLLHAITTWLYLPASQLPCCGMWPSRWDYIIPFTTFLNLLLYPVPVYPAFLCATPYTCACLGGLLLLPHFTFPLVLHRDKT